MANIITCIRIICSIALLFFPALSPVFCILYITAGVSDMVDGTVARKTGTVSEFGSRLDTVADSCFVIVCLIRLLPLLNVPFFLYVWIGIIAAVKAANIVIGYIRQKEFVSVHSIMNKITGGLMFLLPLTFVSIDLKISAVIVCVVATAAAFHEGYLIRTGNVR